MSIVEASPQEATTRSGIVAVVGRPNTGKSSLVNALVGSKVSIVSRRPQTTRHRIQGVCMHPLAQIIFVDTPGLHQQEKRALNRTLNRAATGAMEGVDVILQVVEAGRWQDDDAMAHRRIVAAGVPVVLAVNKVDRVKGYEALLPELASHAERFAYAEIVPVSATHGHNLDALARILAGFMPEGPLLYPEDQRCGHGLDFTVAECVREKLTRMLHQELPYALSVSVESLQESEGLLRAQVVIWVERDAQKKIVIGAGGQTAKQVGIAARRELEKQLGKKVYLQTHVRVRQNWSDDPAALRALGYEE